MAYRETMESLVQRTLEAHGRIQQYIYKTPLTYSIPLSKQSIDCKVFIKLGMSNCILFKECTLCYTAINILIQVGQHYEF